MVRLAHELPGRLRFSVLHLKGDRCGAAAFGARIRALGGVTAADLAPLTGSLVVRHADAPRSRGACDGMGRPCHWIRLPGFRCQDPLSALSREPAAAGRLHLRERVG